MAEPQWRRVPVPDFMIAQWPNARCWQKEVADGHLSVIRTIEPQGGKWRVHLSISHRLSDGTRAPGRYPTWDEQKEACYRFAAGKPLASYLPPEGDESYVNVHETTFHWWEVERWE